MATIRTTGNRHDATFAGHTYRIIEGKDMQVWRLDAGGQALVTNKVELTSLMSFYHWHRRSGRESSELPTLFVKGAKEAD